MKVLITGACGFVGSSIARHLLRADGPVVVFGIDNLVRGGSETNRTDLIDRGVRLIHGDIRIQSDLDELPPVDWIIDAAALPSVLAGVDGTRSSRQLVEHNLIGTLNLLERCRRDSSGLVMLSTSRVYSIEPLSSLPMEVRDEAFVPTSFGLGLSSGGIRESFATSAPVSMYGATKLASETMALEYGLTYDFPVWIDRCGVIGGAGQFGRADQGIFSFWIHSHRYRRPLRYIGFQGSGHQVRDCLHPDDLAKLLQRQMSTPNADHPRIVNVGGGVESAMSLRQLTRWCDERFGPHAVIASDEERPFDLPWVVLDASTARAAWDWKPEVSVIDILDQIADHADANPNWLELSR